MTNDEVTVFMSLQKMNLLAHPHATPTASEAGTPYAPNAHSDSGNLISPHAAKSGSSPFSTRCFPRPAIKWPHLISILDNER